MPSAEKMPESPSIEDRLKSLFAQQEENSQTEKQEKLKAKTTTPMGPPKPPRSPSLNHSSATGATDSLTKSTYKPSQHTQKTQGPRGERLMNGPPTKMTYAQNDNYLYDLDICTCGIAQNHEVTDKSKKGGKMNEITSTDLRHACNRMFVASPSSRNNQMTSTNNQFFQAVNPAFLPDEEHSKGGQNLSLNANSKLYHNQSPVISARSQQAKLPTQHLKSSNQHTRSSSQGFNTDVQETLHSKTASLPRQNGVVHSYMNLQQNPHAASLRSPTPTPYSNKTSHKNGPDHGNTVIVNGHVPRLQTHKHSNERSGSEPPKVSPKPNLDTRSGHIQTGIVYPKPQQPSPRSLTRNEPVRRSTNDYDKVVSDNNMKNLSNIRIPTPLAFIMKNHGKGTDKPSQNRRYSEDSESEGSSLTPPLPPLSAEESSYLSEVESGRPNSHRDSRLTPDLLDAMPRKDKSKKVRRAPSVTTGNKKWTGGEKLKKRKKKRSHHVSATSLNSGTASVDQLKIDYTSDEEVESSDSNYTSGVESSEVSGLRKQIEGMELMYWELLKTLGVKNEVMEKIQHNVRNTQIQQAGKGKKSALVLQHQRTKDVRAVNRRFSRLESHVVTLARSVAHLSSEMRSQNHIVEDMETMKKEVRELTKYLKPRSHRAGRRHDVENFRLILPGLTNPHRVEKLAKFFGEKPPLLHMFLRKLGYEHYIPNFDMENISMIELPYMDDHQLEKIGIPLGPRMRILQEAQLSLQQDNDMGPTLSSNVYFI